MSLCSVASAQNESSSGDQFSPENLSLRGAIQAVNQREFALVETEVVQVQAELELFPGDEENLQWQWVVDAEQSANTKPTEKKRERTEEERRFDKMQSQLARLRKPIRSIDVAANFHNNVPTNRAAIYLSRQNPRLIAASGHIVKPACRDYARYRHRPLYFQEADLERCGNGWGLLTNGMSLGIFLSNTAVLQYRMGTQRPDRCIWNDPDCRTCDTATDDFEPLVKHGFALKGLVAESAALAGFTFLFL